MIRTNVHQDTTWNGSIMARFTSHASQRGHESDYCEAFIHNGGRRELIANFEKTHHDAALVLWLRGQTTYNIVTYTPNSTLLVNADGDGVITTYDNSSDRIEKWYPMTEVSPTLQAKGYNMRSKINMSNTLNVSGEANFTGATNFSGPMTITPQGDIPMGIFQ